MSAPSIYSSEVQTALRKLPKNCGELELFTSDHKIRVFITKGSIFSEPVGMHPQNKLEFSLAQSTSNKAELACEWFKECETSKKSKKEGFQTQTYVWKRRNPFSIRPYVHVRVQYSNDTSLNTIESVRRTVFKILTGLSL